ncbi:MAG: DUF134 domain-containing protein [Clostridiales bacterium]|nr:DUF134 domain-containing protein [Clostridiales bacterium]
MPRPTKRRMICRFPQTLEFIPAKDGDGREPVILTVDEFETIRLIDREGLSQEQCSQRMQVARTTVQKIYDLARKKVADALVEGRPLKIEGGEYCLCNGMNQFCGLDGCYRQEIREAFQKPKGNTVTRIAVPDDNGLIFQHFGRTEQIRIYDIEDGKIAASEEISTDGQGHGILAEIFGAIQADVVICGGIGSGAQVALTSAGIQIYGGVTGSADAAVEAFLAGTLAYDPEVQCLHSDNRTLYNPISRK